MSFIDSHSAVYLYHIFIIAPILIYVGYKQSMSPAPLPSTSWWFYAILVIGILALGSHLMLLYKYITISRMGR